MKNCLLIIFFLLIISLPVLAQSSNDPSQYFKSYVDNGDLLIYASIGYFWGICANAGAELVLGQWDIANIVPIDYSIGARILFQSWSFLGFSETYFGAAPMFIIHMGLAGNFDFYEGIGLGFAFYSGTQYTNSDFEIGFAAISGIAWYLSKNLGLILEYAYIGWTSTWGVGITLKI